MDIDIISGYFECVTSVAPWQDVVDVELLCQEAAWSECDDFQGLIVRIEFQFQSKEFWLVDAGVLIYISVTFNRLVGKNYLNRCAATSLEKLSCRFSKSILIYWLLVKTFEVYNGRNCPTFCLFLTILTMLYLT